MGYLKYLLIVAMTLFVAVVTMDALSDTPVYGAMELLEADALSQKVSAVSTASISPMAVNYVTLNQETISAMNAYAPEIRLLLTSRANTMPWSTEIIMPSSAIVSRNQFLMRYLG